jgi:hypothetical protein
MYMFPDFCWTWQKVSFWPHICASFFQCSKVQMCQDHELRTLICNDNRAEMLNLNPLPCIYDWWHSVCLVLILTVTWREILHVLTFYIFRWIIFGVHISKNIFTAWKIVFRSWIVFYLLSLHWFDTRVEYFAFTAFTCIEMLGGNKTHLDIILIWHALFNASPSSYWHFQCPCT